MDQNVYVISLDTLDWNLLPTVYNLQDEKITPLWSKHNLAKRHNDYYQFEIRSNDSKETVKDELLKAKLESVICDICNIDVPKLFLHEHQKSQRHLTNVKIANIAILRMKNYINNTNNENCCADNGEVFASVYFCALCVAVVDLKEKGIHEKSVAHKNSQVVDGILNNFLDLYNFQDEVDASKENKKQLIKNMDTEIDTVLKFENNSKRENTKKVEQKLTQKMSLKDYLIMINKRIQHPMKFTLHSNDIYIIEIETIDGSIVQVREGNFHGFNKVGKKHMQCYVCKEIFKEKDIEEHKMNEKHIQYMIAPLKDKHCARQIDNSLNHCLICNIITEYSDIHSLCDVDHEINLKNSLISDKLDEENILHFQKLEKEFAIAVKDNLLETEDKDKWIEVTKKGKKVSVGNGALKKESQVIPHKYFCNTCNEIVSTFRRLQHSKTPRHIHNSKSKYHYQLIETENTLVCKVCNHKLPNDEVDIKKHVFEKDHVSQYEKILSDNQIMKLLTDILYCKPCEQVILTKHELSHINTKTHQTNCLSVEYILAVDENIEKESDRISIDHFQCDVCNVKVPNNEYNIQEHMKGRAHALKAEKTIPICDDDTESSDIETTVQSVHYQMEPTRFSTMLNCTVCKIFILQNEMAITEHLASKKHEANYNKIIKDNYLVITLNDCYCNICKVSVGIKSELMHVNGKKHTNNMFKRNSELNSVTAVTFSKSSASADLKVPNVYTPLMSNSVYNKYNVKGANVNNIIPSVSTVNTVNNIDKLSASNVKGINNVNKPSVSAVKSINNTNNQSVSNHNGKNMMEASSVPKDKLSAPNVIRTNVMNASSASIIKAVPTKDIPSVSNVKDIDVMHTPSVSTINGMSNIDKPYGSTVKTSNTIDKLPVSNDIDITPEMLVMLEPTAEPKEMLCKVCNVRVPFSASTIYTHIIGAKHKRAQEASRTTEPDGQTLK